MRRCCYLVIALLALSTHARAQEKTPQTADEYFRRGNDRVTKRDLDGALADFDKAIALEPKFAEAYVDRGNIREIKGDPTGALEDYDKAIALDPELAVAYYDRGNLRHEMYDLDGAIDDLDRAAVLDPAYADGTPHMARGERRYLTRDYDGAIYDFTKAIALNPKEVSAYTLRGNAREAEGDEAGALDDYGKAIALRAAVPKSIERDRDAPPPPPGVAEQEHAGGVASAYRDRAALRRRRGDYVGAVSDYKQSVALDPDFPEAFNDLAWQLATSPDRKARDGKQAVRYALDACKLTGWADGGFLDTLAAAYAEAGDFRRAVEWERKALGSREFQKEEGKKARLRLELFRRHRPYREP